MTTAQRYTLLIDGKHRDGSPHTSLWTAACKVNNWPKNDRAFRLGIISKAVGRPLQSTTELNNTDDMDRVFRFLRAAADDLTAARELDETELGRARRLVFKVREVESELAAYPGGEPMGADGVRRLVRSLCADIANKGRSVRVEIMDVEDLSAKPIEFRRNGKPRKIPSQLDQLLITLTRMLSKYKKEGSAACVQSDPDYSPVNRLLSVPEEVESNEPF